MAEEGGGGARGGGAGAREAAFALHARAKVYISHISERRCYKPVQKSLKSEKETYDTYYLLPPHSTAVCNYNLSTSIKV